MWTNRVVANNGSELFVEFTSPDNRKFVKKYSIPDIDISIFLANKLSDIETLSATFTSMQTMKNVNNDICDGWMYKLVGINMSYDYIELVAEIQSPNHQTFYKIFQTVGARDIAYMSSWMNSEASKVAEWVQNNDIVSLSDYFGVEVTEWQQ